MDKYLINQTETHVSISSCNILIERGGYSSIDAESVKNPDVADALRRKWVKISDVEPIGTKPFVSQLTMQVPDIVGTTKFPTPGKKAKAKK